MKYLFIDASENLTHIQTGTENGFNAETIDTNRDFAAKITEICDNMLKNAGWEQKDLTHLIVCTGPGSLTGLRVADGFLRTLAMLLDIPLIGIDLFKWSIQTLSDRNFVQNCICQFRRTRNNHFYSGHECCIAYSDL